MYDLKGRGVEIIYTIIIINEPLLSGNARARARVGVALFEECARHVCEYNGGKSGINTTEPN